MLVEVLQEIMLIHILVIFAVVEFLKVKVIKPHADVPGWFFFLLSIGLGIAVAFGWGLRLLPDPELAQFDYLDAVLTGIILGAAASGFFSGLDEFLPDLNL